MTLIPPPQGLRKPLLAPQLQRVCRSIRRRQAERGHQGASCQSAGCLTGRLHPGGEGRGRGRRILWGVWPRGQSVATKVQAASQPVATPQAGYIQVGGGREGHFVTADNNSLGGSWVRLESLLRIL